MRHRHLSYADWSRAEYAKAFLSLILGEVSDGEHIKKLTERLSKLYAPGVAYPLNFGRSAIRIALKVFGTRRPGCDEVIIPAYICPSVIDTVRDAGFKVRFADIGDDLNIDPSSVATLLNDKTLAVIVPHMYGCPARITEIEAVCQAARVFMIDDAAQVVGIEHEGRLLGTFGDVGILSFAQSKTVVTGVRGSGGALLLNNQDLTCDISKACHDLPAARHRGQAFLHFLWNYMWLRYTGTSGYYFARLHDALHLGKQEAEHLACIANLDAGVALAQIDRLPLIHRRKVLIAEMYFEELKKLQEIRVPQYAPGRYLSRVMLLLPPGVSADAVRTSLKIAGVETRVGYQPPIANERSFSSAAGIAKRLIEVPSGSDISAIDVQKICTAVRDSLRSHSSVGDLSHETYQTPYQG